jgi:hypothetical protein
VPHSSQFYRDEWDIVAKPGARRTLLFAGVESDDRFYAVLKGMASAMPQLFKRSSGFSR